MSPSTEKKTKFKANGKISRRAFLALPPFADKSAKALSPTLARGKASMKRVRCALRLTLPLASVGDAE